MIESHKLIQPYITQLQECGFNCLLNNDVLTIEYVIKNEVIKPIVKQLVNATINLNNIDKIILELQHLINKALPNSIIPSAKFDELQLIYSAAKLSKNRDCYLEISNIGDTDYVIYCDMRKNEGFFVHALTHDSAKANEVIAQIIKSINEVY